MLRGNPKEDPQLHIGAQQKPNGIVDLIEQVEFYRFDATRKLDPATRIKMGQFLTPAPTARLMASMFESHRNNYSLLDAGAGIGSLSASWLINVCSQKPRPNSISITAYESDPLLAEYLESTLQACTKECNRIGISFDCHILKEDFIDAAVDMIKGGLFSKCSNRFNTAILNPPYRKISSDSKTRHLLRSVGIETSNLYTAFLWLVIRLLEPGGEFVAITPRSFCNGPYFKPFRKALLEETSLRRLHIFESRQCAFKDDDVLQENIIFQSIKGTNARTKVMISSSSGPEDENVVFREMNYQDLVQSNDPDSFIHIVPDELNLLVTARMQRFTTSLSDLDISVSTGRVVDFRAKPLLRKDGGPDSVPLIYPTHFSHGFIEWPKKNTKKPNAIDMPPFIRRDDILVPAGIYVLVKRFSSKEEPRRIVAAIYDPSRINASEVGFENHLNYFHRNGKGLSMLLAKGLAAFLNSSLVDSYFRLFNGHTQVNATDLKSFKYPSKEELEALGSRIDSQFPDQDKLDQFIEEELFIMPEDAKHPDPIPAKKKIQEALQILKFLGFPKAQQNERSALTLLALLDLKSDTPWAKASAPLRGITPMMDFFSNYYGKTYAPNSRETVRRQTVHQFLDAGLIVANPDEPSRPINSGKTVYRIEENALLLLKNFGLSGWTQSLQTYLSSIETLKKRYAQEREMQRIPIQIAPGKTITLSPGGQNVLVQEIIKEFCSRFTPDGQLVYVGDTDDKWAYFDEGAFKSLGIEIDYHGKMPDVIVFHKAKGWLVLIEAVTSHGPVNPKRQIELKTLFKGCTVGLVFVTAFLTRKTMVEYLDDISWETEVWVAESPSHLIHFNGERFLGPY